MSKRNDSSMKFCIYNINKQAISDGMVSLEQDGIIKALNGQTSLEEVYRVAKTQGQ